MFVFACHLHAVSSDETVERCSGCHSAKIEQSREHKEYIKRKMSCPECHGDIKTKNGAVRRQNCYFCHADKERIRKKERAKKIQDGELLHGIHIPGRKVECVSCHDFMDHGED